jgi:glyoxylase-like metal-dependent hydrolase (beta-lactamase superfamily II)
VLIDAGIGVSRPQMEKALAGLGADPVAHLINTHWHFDHASGNEWLHAAGVKIIAQENTRKHLSEIQRVEDWDYNFLPQPSGGILSEVFATEHNLKLNGISPGLKYYGPAHTDGDISVTFAEANNPSRRRYFLEWNLPFHRLLDRRQHRPNARGVRRQSRRGD